MADAWRRTDVRDITIYAPSGYGHDNIRAAIAFSFFSILSWVGTIPCQSFLLIVLHIIINILF